MADGLQLLYAFVTMVTEDVHLPITLQCGGTQHVLHDAVLWMSSGGTKSVLHSDKLDNLLCVLSGTKDVILIDKVCGVPRQWCTEGACVLQ